MKATFEILSVTKKGHFSIVVQIPSGIEGVTTVKYAVWLVIAPNAESYIGKKYTANIEFGKGEVTSAEVTGAKEIKVEATEEEPKEETKGRGRGKNV